MVVIGTTLGKKDRLKGGGIFGAGFTILYIRTHSTKRIKYFYIDFQYNPTYRIFHPTASAVN